MTMTRLLLSKVAEPQPWILRGTSRQLKVRQRQKLSATGTGQGARRYPLEPLRMMVTSQTRTAHCHLTPSQGPLREIPHNCPQLAIFS